jgi:hypothetical protein
VTTPTPDALIFKIKANDRRPSLGATLGFKGSSAVPSLAGAAVNFVMKPSTRNGVPVVGGTFLEKPAVIVDAGDYLGEFEVVGSDGLTQTFPTDGYIPIIIYADLDGAA